MLYSFKGGEGWSREQYILLYAYQPRLHRSQLFMYTISIANGHNVFPAPSPSLHFDIEVGPYLPSHILPSLTPS